MEHLASFLEKYDTVIFDMDGVITSEQNYWNSATLTIYEYLNDKKYFGKDDIDVGYAMDNLKKIRERVFCDDKLIATLKGKGVNSNWDLGYVVVCIALILKTDNFEKVHDYAKCLGDNILYEYDSLGLKASESICWNKEDCLRSGKLWEGMQRCFQEWFLGDEIFIDTYREKPNKMGKTGLLFDEKPLISLESLQKIFYLLSQKNKRICTGTGRPYCEILYPLRDWDILKYIAKDGFINYNHVVDAQKDMKDMTLTKPHPFMFLKALFGEQYENEKLLNGGYDDKKIKTTLVVGDAGADILAAQAMGADFCAVLTGVLGISGKSYFEKLGATYILDSLESFLEK